MKIAVVIEASGLIGGEAVSFFSEKFDLIVGIDNDLRQYFFGEKASTKQNNLRLLKQYKNYQHEDIDIRDYAKLEKIFQSYQKNIALIVHTAAQPSHDWASREPLTDFGVNALGTINLLELTRKFSP